MKNIKCPACGGKTKRNGKTSSGATRWRCLSCGASTTQRYDDTAKRLELFLSWLLSKKTQSEMGMPARTFRSLTMKFWEFWPVAPVSGEVHHVIHVDGLWLSGKVVILIACTEDHVVGWHLARSENSQAWAALMLRMAPPDIVITDGGSGFEKARRIIWPNTRVQRCTFHAFCQIKRCTTTRPKLQAGVELYGIAKNLMRVVDLNDAAEWMASFASWCGTWDRFLKEKVILDGKSQYKHERLRKARRGLEALVRAGTLFTYLDEDLQQDGTIPATNNRIEGGVNRQLRMLINEHRGMCLTHRIKAIFWWCATHTEYPPTSTQILTTMPTDTVIANLYKAANDIRVHDRAVDEWGTAISWSDLHFSDPYRFKGD